MMDNEGPDKVEANSDEARKGARRSSAPERVDVRVRPERRRNWSPEDKLSIVRETLQPGAMAKVLADRHGISTGLLFTWRKQMLATAMSGFAPMPMVPETMAPPPSAAAKPLAIAGPADAVASLPGVLELEPPCGTCIRANRDADAELLRGALVTLSRR